MNTFSERLKSALAFRQFRQRDLVELSGICPSTISAYMTGYRVPGLKQTVRLAQALDINPEYLLGKIDVLEETYLDEIIIKLFRLSKDEQKKVLSFIDGLHPKIVSSGILKENIWRE